MVSIREAVDSLERIHQMRVKVLDCYLGALRDMARYAIDLDESLTPPHRKALEELADEVSGGDDGMLDDSRGMLRAILRDYRDKASAYLSSLKDELASTARGFEELLESLALADGDEEARMRAALNSLRAISASAAAAPVRTGIVAAANSIDESLQQIRKQHQLMVAQFQVEIRMLHKRIDTLETAASVDSVTKLLKRGETEEQIRAAARAYCLLLVRVGGFHAAERSYGSDAAVELAAAFTKRLRNSMPAEAVIGRWGYEDFVSMLSENKAEVTPMASWIAEHLSGAYSLLNEGKLIHPRLQVSVAVVEGGPGTGDTVIGRVREFLTGRE